MRTRDRLVVAALVVACFTIVYVRLSGDSDLRANVLPQRHRELS